MCSENKMLHIFYIVLVCLMATLLFCFNVLNYSELLNLQKNLGETKIEKLLTSVNEKYNYSSNLKKIDELLISVVEKCNNSVNVKYGAENFCKQFNVSEDFTLILKNELSKFENKIMNKLSNLEEIVERVYDYAALIENSRINDNYNFYNLVKNQVIEYFEAKINMLMDKKCGT